jgi:K+-transporting ATPase ATPase B chain
VVLAKQRFNLRERDVHALKREFVHFSAQTRMSGVDLPGRERRSARARPTRSASMSRHSAALSADEVLTSSRRRGAPRQHAAGRRRRHTVLGVVELKDIVKGGIKERFAELRRMGIKTVMITGDNRLTAAAIAAEAGVDDFLAEATPKPSSR